MGIMDANLRYSEYAQELKRLLDDDQQEWRKYAKAEFESDNSESLKEGHNKLRSGVDNRTARVLKTLHDIGEPTLMNIGDWRCRCWRLTAV